MIELETEARGDGMVIAVRGRLDMVTAKDLRACVTEVLEAGARVVVVDLGGTEFIDSSGLGAVVAGLKSARQRGGDLRIANVDGQVGVVLGLTNLDRVLRPYASVDEAFDDG